MRSNMNRRGYLLVSGLLLILGGCSGVPSKPVNPVAVSGAKVAGFLTDAPADGIVAFRIDVTGATLVGSDGLSTSISNGVQEIEVRHLQLAPTLAFQTANALAGNYTSLNMTLANVQITTSDSQGNVAVLNAQSVPSVRLANVAIHVPINLNLQANSTSDLMIDFNLQGSIKVDANGNYIVTPELTLDALNNSDDSSVLEAAAATVISSPASNVYDLQLEDTAQIVRVVAGPNTLLVNENAQPAFLQTGQDVEFDAQLQADGSFLASRINTISPNPALCYRGVVVGINSSASGNVLAVVVQE